MSETTPMASNSDVHGGSAPYHTILLLWLSVGASGLAGVAMALWLSHARIATPTALGVSVGVAMLVGLALSWPLLARLAQLDRALARLVAGEPVAPQVGGWPLSQLLWRVEALNERIAQSAERERQAATYRDEVMRQVGEAAAREERNRLARELHDSIKQQLFSIGVSAAAARARSGATGEAGEAGEAGVNVALADIERGAHEAQVEMTALLQQLRPAPLENVGLVAALRDQCEALGYRTGAEVSVTIGALPTEDRLPVGAQEQLFRIAQEALANVARHARAQHVWLRLAGHDDAILLEIRDDGQGFDSAIAHGGMGLDNLRERARALGGSAEIQSAPGHGATIRIHAPLIEPLRLTPEERARRAAVQREVRSGDRFQRWGLVSLQITFIVMLLGLPIWAVALAGGVAGGLYLLGLRAQREVIVLTGRNAEESLTLRHRSREIVIWLVVLLALCLWYLPVSAPGLWASGPGLGIVTVGSAALLALGLLCWEGWRRMTARYFQLLSPARRHPAIQRQWDETVSLGAILVFIIALGLLLGGWSPAWPPRTVNQWSDTASVAALGLLVICDAVELIVVWRWRRTLDGASNSGEAREPRG
ncbi:MAG TPA: sensor histidine kinase [Ktedonobacterales bacterium]|jgi:signal transduction histidine kinase|nr:sensor histidine kinase [Ktedonobacterales bacterium]